ncbi:MAG: dienelactone hydrolase family protein [Bradyrhizobium sp.]
MIRRFIGLLVFALAAPAAASAGVPETVYLASADGRTELVGYLFMPAGSGPYPAVVMLHGRGGPYSTNVNRACTLVARSTNSPCNAATLSKRHRTWGEYWAAQGYLALLVDSFGPRGKAYGFGRFTHGDPVRDDVNERTVRPLDAEGALAWLRKRRDVVADDIFLQGWSNGGSTALNVIYRQGMQTSGFRAALAFYPGCGPKAMLGRELSSKVPVTMFLASEDEEVSPALCQQFAQRSREAGSPVDVVLYPGAVHGFDDPGARRQSATANRSATTDAFQRALATLRSLGTR